MGGKEDLAEVLDGDEGVDLGGGDRGVTEKFLHDPDVGTPVQQVGGEAVPQRMRRHLEPQVGDLRRLLQHAVGALPAEPLPLAVHLGLDPVEIITGPGNVYVAAAKRLVRGAVGIDSEAGPTEILVIADATADAYLVATDLISQAEHDELAAVVLVTDSPELADAVSREVERLVASTNHSARVRIAVDGVQSAMVLVSDMVAAAAFSNAYGPEHLEIQTAEPESVLDMIESAGAIFLGAHSPVSLGDYLAGSNHVLPTGGQSRFASGLGAYTFLRPQQVISYDRSALESVSSQIVALSEAEDLPAHGAAVSARFEDRS